MRAPIISLKEAVLRAHRVRDGHRTVVLANGAFDLLHVGHLRYLEAAAALGDWLLVAVNSDHSVRLQKGPQRPIVALEERMEMLSALRAVDALVSFDEGSVAGIIEAIRPDVHAKGTDYTELTVPEAPLVLRLGGRVAICGDAKAHSTTQILESLRSRPVQEIRST